MFDGSIGAGSVFMPYGGKYQLTETQAMVAKLPVLKGHYRYSDYDEPMVLTLILSSWSPYHGAVYAVTVIRSQRSWRPAVITGRFALPSRSISSRMTEDPSRWSQPFAALLGAYSAQMGFGLPSIGGKDSMSRNL